MICQVEEDRNLFFSRFLFNGVGAVILSGGDAGQHLIEDWADCVRQISSCDQSSKKPFDMCFSEMLFCCQSHDAKKHSSNEAF